MDLKNAEALSSVIKSLDFSATLSVEELKNLIHYSEGVAYDDKVQLMHLINSFSFYPAQDDAVVPFFFHSRFINGQSDTHRVVKFMDSNGIIRVAKRNVDIEYRSREDLVLERLIGVKGVPQLHDIRDDWFIMSYCYGIELSCLPREYFDLRRWLEIFEQTLCILSDVHERGVWHCDIRPQNILVRDDCVSLIDYDFAQIVSNIDFVTDASMADIKYMAPETLLYSKAQRTTDVFQLATVMFEALTGFHPFTLSESCHDVSWSEDSFIRYALCNLTQEPKFELLAMVTSDSTILAELKNIFEGMFLKDSIKRIGVDDAIGRIANLKCLLSSEAISYKHHTASSCEKYDLKCPMVLFPARMGIPHKGHIEYISRLIDLGFHVKISLQRSYTITEIDPLPKWIVMKIVARALLARGYKKEQFSFIFTPLFEKLIDMRLYFCLLVDDFSLVSAIASSNESVWELFPKHKIIDQEALFGDSSNKYEVKSWGRYIRKALSENDEDLFYRYFPLSRDDDFMTMRDISAITSKCNPVEFIGGAVYLDFSDFGIEQHARLSKYDNLYNVIAKVLKAESYDVYTRYSLFVINEETCMIDIADQIFDGKNLVLKVSKF